MPEAFSTIVAPLDLEPNHDRAVAAAAGLAAVGNLPIILMTASSPGLPNGRDQIELGRIAEKHHLDRWSAVVLHDNQPARVVAAHLLTLDAPLVVMATGVRGMISQLSSTHTAASLLGAINCPALVLGPNVPDTWQPRHAQLVCCIDPGEPAYPAVPWVVRWLKAFGGRDPCFVAVKPSDSAPDTPACNRPVDVERLAAGLYSTAGFLADWNILRDDNPVNGLLAFTADNVDALLVVTSKRWTDDSRLHRHSIARNLAHASVHPVLVVPYGCHDAQ